MSTRTVLAQALQLPPSERADIAKHLIASLDAPADDNTESAWLAEVERRLQDNHNNPDAFSSWQASRARIAERLRAKYK